MKPYLSILRDLLYLALVPFLSYEASYILYLVFGFKAFWISLIVQIVFFSIGVVTLLIMNAIQDFKILKLERENEAMRQAYENFKNLINEQNRD